MIILIHPPSQYYFQQLVSEQVLLKKLDRLKKDLFIMSNYEREAFIRPPVFDGTNFNYWKVELLPIFNLSVQKFGTS